MSLLERPTTARRREIRCPDCGAPRMVSLEHACRINRGESSAKCMLCRKPPRIEVTDDHLAYWLRLGGVTDRLPGPTGARAYVQAHGVPSSLEPIIASGAFLDFGR